MLSLATPLAIALAMATALIALIAAAMRIGLSEEVGIALMVPSLFIPPLVALASSATLQSRAFFTGSGSFARIGTSVLGAAVVLLVITALQDHTVDAAILNLPLILLVILLHRVLALRPSQGEFRTSALDRMREEGLSLPVQVTVALCQCIILALLLLLLLPTLVEAVAIATGLTQLQAQGWMLFLLALTIGLGGQRSVSGLAMMLVGAVAISTIAILVSATFANRSLLLPGLTSPERLEPVREVMAAWLPKAQVLPFYADPFGAFLATPLVEGCAFALAVIGLLSLLRIEDNAPARMRRPSSLGNTLIYAVLFAFFLAALPINAILTLADGLIGFDPRALPLWLADGRFSDSISICGKPLDAFAAGAALCANQPDLQALGISDIVLDADFATRPLPLASGLPVVASWAIALILALGMIVPFALVFVRLAMLFVRDVMMPFRSTQPTGSWSLAMTRLTSVMLALLLWFLPLSAMDGAVLRQLFVPLAAGLLVPALVLLRFGFSGKMPMTVAVLTGPLFSLAALSFMSTSWATLLGVTGSIVCGVVAKGWPVEQAAPALLVQAESSTRP
jgi:hypothetical protein